jgi:asparagine synthase (glutamine-hydrolysing)
MPGIVGLITKKKKEEASQLLSAMLYSVSHETFYSKGSWVEESLGLYVGWTARKGSFCDGMPLRNEREDVVLVFSGEEYPHPATAQSLKTGGHVFDSEGPSYLVHLYEEDREFPAGLNGRFHGLLADRGRERVMLFNDRFGMQRLYFHESADTFYFAVEAKAILAVCPELKKPNWQSLGEFAACGAVLENRTLFQGIEVLPPASAWTLRAGTVEKRTSYFNASEWEEQGTLDPESYYEALSHTFIQNLPRYFQGQERIGMSLTAGLDTRMVMACANARPGSLPCYTFGSMFRENQDVRNARKVARACDQPFQVLTAGKEFLAQFPKYAERAVFLTDGCVDVSRAPDLFLNERAREIAPVRMTGLYGGEILRGVRAFKPAMPDEGLFSKEFLGDIQRTSTTYKRLADSHPISFAAFKQNPWYLFGPLSIEQTQLQVRSPFLDNDFLRVVFRHPAGELKDNTVSWRLVADGNRALKNIPTDRGLTADGTPSEAIRHSILEFSFKAEYAYDMGMPQWLARFDHAFSSLHLERAFLGRHKPFHFRVWYRDALAEYVREVLLDQRSLSRPYIERRGLESVVTGHLKGNRNFTTELHKLLTLELLHRLFLDSDSSVLSPGKASSIEACSR